MANLSATEITKPGREWRAAKLADMIASGQPLEITGGKKIILVASSESMKALRKNPLNSTTLSKMTFKSVNESNTKIYKLTDLVKTVEFGGKGERGGVLKEDAALESLNNQITEIQTKTKKPFVKIRVGDDVFKIQYAESTPGTPKSDFHLIDMNGEECVWISHKDGRGPKDFQQWGGISQSKEPLVFSHPETQRFIKDIKEKYGTRGLPPATSLVRPIKDKRLKMIAVYGNQFGSSLGRQNVSILLQGPITLDKSGDAYELKANHVHNNGDSVDSDGFDPAFMAVYKGDRSDAGIGGTRIVIQPITGRKATPF
jgi:hypothetical protein